MNGKDIFLGLKYIGEDLIHEAEYETLTPKTQAEKQVRRAFRRPLLIAAAIALMVALVGCAVAYVLSLERVKIGDRTEERDVFATDSYNVIGTETVSQTVMSLAGIQGSPAYQACADFYAFQDAYIADMNAMMEAGTLPEGFFEHDTYGKAMTAKAQELAETYGLKPEGNNLGFRTVRTLCDALGVERFFRETEGITANVTMGSAWEGGNIRLYLDLYFPEDSGYEVLFTNATLRWNRKDCFSRDYVTLDNTGDWTEKLYTTSTGREVLILYSPSNEYGYLLCDREEALMSLQFTYRLDAWNQVGDRVWADSYYMTEKQMELMAETVDFNIQPRLVAQADVDAQAVPSYEATQNGWTLKLKNVDTDGYAIHLLFSLTAPDGIDISGSSDELRLQNGNLDILTCTDGRRKSSGSGRGFILVDDGDGLDNTTDLALEFEQTMDDGSAPFGIGTTWDVDIVDLVASSWDPETVSYREETLVEGEWHFSLTFDESSGDYREIELVTESFPVKASTGWYPDGTDAVEEFTVTSFLLRKYTSTIRCAECDERNTPDFYFFNRQKMYAVMKDGSEIEMLGSHDEIDLNQVDHIVFPDGTILKVPET